MNKELLLRVKEAILAHPEHFDMFGFMTGPKFIYESSETVIATIDDLNAGQCGTTACIAGWAVALSPKDEVRKAYSHRADIGDVAAFFLGYGLDGFDNLMPLFYDDYWPRDLKDRYRAASREENYLEMAKAAAETIERFIAEHEPSPTPATGGQEG
jgi:hypothetical protein